MVVGRKINIMQNEIKNFVLLNIIGSDDYIAIKKKDKLISKKIQKKDDKNDNLVTDLFKFIKTHDLKLDRNTSILVNIGPGSFSSLRISISIAKGIGIAKGIKIYGFRNEDLKEFSDHHLNRLLSKKLLENKLIKPIYLS
tara:strand:+ start:2385 stop:2804 length:420 start_codon:yes stop_codon:yes gene_type:complete